MFVKKEEKQTSNVMSNDDSMMHSIEAVVNYISSSDDKNYASLADKLMSMAKTYDMNSLSKLGRKITKKQLNRDDSEIVSILMDIGILSLVKYFKERKVGTDKKTTTALTIFSVLPPSVRIMVWEQVIKEDHSLIVIDKLLKAYAKNGQIDDLKKKIKDWICLGYLTEREAENLYDQARLLYMHRSNLPIAADMKNAKKNYDALMQTVDRNTDVDGEFITAMDMLFG